MKKIHQYLYTTIFILVIICTLTACAFKYASNEHRESTLSVSSEVKQRVLTLVEQLYLNSRELKEVYRDLRSVAQVHAFSGDDEQLNYVQKAALYIQKSYLSAIHQWEFLSLMEDIRPAAIVDYYTLRYKGLSQAIVESASDERFITIYHAYINNAAAFEDIEAAIKLIVDNRNLFKQLTEAIAPLVRNRDADTQL